MSPLRFLLHLLLGLWLALPLPGRAAAAGEIRAEVSRNPVALNESFQLTFEAAEQPDGPPEFAPLGGDFDILDHNQSQNVQIVNGRTSRQLRWNLTLMAKRAGELEIPAVRFGSRSSAPIKLRVTDAPAAKPGDTSAQGEEIYLEAELTPNPLRVQQQALLRVRLFRAVDIVNASLSPPQPAAADTLVKKLGEDQDFETSVNGRRYRVTERRYALFPQSPGTLAIPPLAFQGEVLKDRAARDPFGLPFGGMMQRGQVRRVQSAPLSAEVLPAPAGPGPWLPASNLQLSEAWPGGEPEFRVGEPITRNLLLLADGLTAAQLPPLDMRLPEGLGAYPDKPGLNDREHPDGITGIREEKVAIVPTRTGEFLLPAIEVRWWNSESGKPETARIPERRIRVLPKAGAAPATPPPAALPAAGVPPAPAVPPPPAEEPAAPPPPVQDPGLWPWVALGLGIGWLGTLLGWWLSRRGNGGPAPSTAPPPPARTIGLPELKSACLSGNPEAAANALLIWAAGRWPESPPRSLGALAGRLGGSAAEGEIRALERLLYSPSKEGWSGSDLWKVIGGLRGEENSSAATADPLAPLYPR